MEALPLPHGPVPQLVPLGGPEGRLGHVGQRLGPADVLHRLQHLKVHRRGSVGGRLLAKVLAELVGAGKGLLPAVVAAAVVVEVE